MVHRAETAPSPVPSPVLKIILIQTQIEIQTQIDIQTQIEIHTSMESQYLDLWLYVDINIDEKIMSTTKL